MAQDPKERTEFKWALAMVVIFTVVACLVKSTQFTAGTATKWDVIAPALVGIVALVWLAILQIKDWVMEYVAANNLLDRSR